MRVAGPTSDRHARHITTREARTGAFHLTRAKTQVAILVQEAQGIRVAQRSGTTKGERPQAPTKTDSLTHAIARRALVDAADIPPIANQLGDEERVSEARSTVDSPLRHIGKFSSGIDTTQRIRQDVRKRVDAAIQPDWIALNVPAYAGIVVPEVVVNS